MTQTVLITGTSSGFGEAATRYFAEHGWNVIATMRDTSKGINFSGIENVEVLKLDVQDVGSIQAAIDQGISRFGRIDVVINNAGYGILGAAEELTDEQIDHQIATNLTGSIQVARAAIPHLREQGGGRIIQISTMGGQATFPGATLYHASKWGIEGFMESLRYELAPFNIGVTIVEPGSTGTNFGKNLVIADPLEAYADGPVGQTRAFFGSGTYESPGDAVKTVKVVIQTIDQNPTPLRLATGSDAYGTLHKAISTRLAELEAQKTVAASTDRN